MMENLKKVLMERDGLTEQEADTQIADAKENLLERLGNGEMPFDFCEEEFGLEPDYFEDLIF
jgi:hypothetical protein